MDNAKIIPHGWQIVQHKEICHSFHISLWISPLSLILMNSYGPIDNSTEAA